MKKKKDLALNNTKIAVGFFVFLIFIVGVSLVFKVITLVRQGQFDSSRKFILTISNGRNIEVISLSPVSKDITIFKLNVAVLPAEAGRLLRIPIDGFISSDSIDLNQKIKSLFMDAVFNYKSLKTNLTVIDLLRIAVFARTIPESSVNVRKITDSSRLGLDKAVGRLASDVLIERDNQTIRIVNATAVGGLGNRLAKLVTNMGGDVIIVATENSQKKKSVILYIDEKTYTVKRLQEVLGYEAVKEENNAISDITIIIGKDKVNIVPF